MLLLRGTLPSGEIFLATIRCDNTIAVAFPERRRVYHHAVPAAEDDLYTLAAQPGFAIVINTLGRLTLHNYECGGPVYIWCLDDADASRWAER